MQPSKPLIGMAKQMLLTKMDAAIAKNTPSGKRPRSSALLHKKLEKVGKQFTVNDLAEATGLTREGAKALFSMRSMAA